MSFLPGMFPGGAMMDSGLTLSHLASVTASAPAITVPASVQAGDLLVLWDFAFRGQIFSIPAEVVPSGFMVAVNFTSESFSSIRHIISYKIATGADANASLTGMNSDFEGKALIVFRGSKPIQAVSHSSGQGQISQDDPAGLTIASGIVQAPLIVFGGYSCGGGGATIDPRTMTPTKDGEAQINVQNFAAWKLFNFGPINVFIDMDDEGDNNLVAGCCLACE